MQFNARDQRILEHIYSYGGALSEAQLHRLEFPNASRKACTRRLIKLFHNGYLARTSKTGTSHSGGTVYWLTKQGAGQVAPGWDAGIPLSQFVLDPAWSQIRHDLKIVDFLLAMQQACEGSKGAFKLREWLTERELRAEVKAVSYTTLSGRKTSRKVIPDAYLRIERRKPGQKPFSSRLLLEMDNSTHPNGRFAENKILPGLQWIKGESYRQRFGAARGRWLVVTKSRERLEYLRETTHRVAGKEAFLWNFTTFDDLNPQTILSQPIWYPGDLQRPSVALFPNLP
jgi:hypothetical protein